MKTILSGLAQDVRLAVRVRLRLDAGCHVHLANLGTGLYESMFVEGAMCR
jgi:hypothetical protein